MGLGVPHCLLGSFPTSSQMKTKQQILKHEGLASSALGTQGPKGKRLRGRGWNALQAPPLSDSSLEAIRRRPLQFRKIDISVLAHFRPPCLAAGSSDPRREPRAPGHGHPSPPQVVAPLSPAWDTHGRLPLTPRGHTHAQPPDALGAPGPLGMATQKQLGCPQSLCPQSGQTFPSGSRCSAPGLPDPIGPSSPSLSANLSGASAEITPGPTNGRSDGERPRGLHRGRWEGGSQRGERGQREESRRCSLQAWSPAAGPGAPHRLEPGSRPGAPAELFQQAPWGHPFA